MAVADRMWAMHSQRSFAAVSLGSPWEKNPAWEIQISEHKLVCEKRFLRKSVFLIEIISSEAFFFHLVHFCFIKPGIFSVHAGHAS